MRHDRDRLLDILEAIEKIGKYSSEGRRNFMMMNLVRVWIVHYLEILGEAARGVGVDVREMAPEIPWTKMGNVRNILAHQYFEVDEDIVWTIVEKELPKIKSQVKNLLKQLPSK